jgi:hypothetical protein
VFWSVGIRNQIRSNYRGWRGRAAAACALAWSLVARAADLTVIAGGEPLAVPWPAGMEVTGGEFLIELDGYDITSVVGLDAERLLLPLPQLALEPGRHALRVSRHDAGDTTVLIEHVLDVYQRPGVRRASRQWNVLLSSGWQLDEYPQAGDDGRQHTESTLQWSGEYETASWRASDTLSALYSPGVPGMKSWQLPGYELRAGRRIGTAQLGLALGDDAPPLDNLLFSGFSRRGLRADLAALEERVRAQIFTLHTDPVTAVDADVVPLDAATSMVGGFATVAPFAAHPDALVLTAGWVDGSGTNGGAGIATPEGAFTTGGSAWNAALDGYAWQRALWLHGEFARSDFDTDGSGQRVRDEATAASLQLSSNGGLSFQALDQWSLGLEQRRVGAHFYAISNLSLPGDLELRRAHLGLGRRGFSLETVAFAQRTDVDDLALRPRIDTRSGGVSLQYAPMWADAARAPWRWLGTPTFTAAYERASNRQMDGDALALGFDVDDVQRNATAGLQFSSDAFGVGFDYARIERDDRTEPIFVDGFEIYLPSGDTREHTFGINAWWRPNERLSLAPQWQRVRHRDLATGAESHSDLWSAQVQAVLVREVLTLQASWSDTRDSLRALVPLDQQRSSSHGGAFDLAYRPTPGRGALPQVDCHLRAAYSGNTSVFAAQSSSAREWRVSLSFDFTWSRN